MRTRARPSRRNVSRRWCIPPAILREPEEMLEASQILDEIPGDVGLILWQALRDVTLWSSVPQERHAGLFGGEAAGKRLRLLLASGAEPALEVWLTALTNVVANPVTVSPDIVSLVCMQLSRWAEARGALATALCYAQAGALATPEDPAPAYSVGTLALRWRRNTRAETWLRRAVGLARRAKDWNVYAQAHVDLASLYARRGAREPAQRSYVQAVRAARRHGLMPVRGAALHGMFLLAMEAGELDEAERFAKLAMRAYGRGHPRLAELAHDTAYLWVTRDSYTRAIPILQKQLNSRVEPVERALTLSILARAAAGAGELKLYQDSSMDAWAIISRKPGEEARHARALLELARAGVKARDWVHMDRAARAALSAAARTGETTITAQVEALLAQLRRNLRL